ncbi:hypothetical protein N7474_008381 [Penicillium riverlandense]|uniref:uncharacterized protein n=1 Tax=Penicillium riverlandense TaxID=1903569 RepID=UPI0025468C61|nr:uncharacterized protein N7474_008381 [Penicillium riverlandense]KAJ5812080.1 hypothetical protein N7474_008381 [Penicillium riverlandense]
MARKEKREWLNFSVKGENLEVNHWIQDRSVHAEASYMAIGTAARLALGLGLHRTLVDSLLTTNDVEERRNVFWVLYVMDRGVSLRLGRPPTICEDDIEVSEPTPSRKLQSSPAKDGFAHFVKLNRIKSEIYSKLYSVRSLMGDGQTQRLATLHNLDEKLTTWQNSLPSEMLSFEKALQSLNAHLITMTMLLHAEFYNCQLMLYRTDSYWDALDSSIRTTTSSAEFSEDCSREKCLTAARHAAELLDRLQQSGKMFQSNLARYDAFLRWLSAFVRQNELTNF